MHSGAPADSQQACVYFLAQLHQTMRIHKPVPDSPALPTAAYSDEMDSTTELEQQTRTKLNIASSKCNVRSISSTAQDIRGSVDSLTEVDDDKYEHRRSPCYGSKWTSAGGALWVSWCMTPDLSQIKATLCNYSPLPDTASYTVMFLDEGTGHKVFRVFKSHMDQFVMRLALRLVDGGEITISEQATHDFLCAGTNGIRVPKIIASCANASEEGNDVGLEWMLMTYLDTEGGDDQWDLDSLDFQVRKSTVKEVNHYHTELYRFRFNQIGSLFPSGDAANPRIGPLVAKEFFLHPYEVRDDIRGPYKNSCHWLYSRLEHASDQIDKIRQSFHEEKELSYADVVEKHIPSPKEALSMLFSKGEAEHMSLFHIDTHSENFFVDKHGHLKGMLD